MRLVRARCILSIKRQVVALYASSGGRALETAIVCVVAETCTPAAPKLRRRRDAFANAARDAALRLLADRGYANFALADVAATAGIHRASLYRRWPTKAALVVDAVVSALPVAPEDAFGANATSLEAAATALARFVESSTGRAVLRLLVSVPEDPELEAATRAAWSKIIAFAPGANEEIDPELPVPEFTVAGAIIHRVLVERRPVTDRFVAALVQSVHAAPTYKRDRQ
jgi:AcrR family transcriptional regulator